jgi:hypothetical protein
MLQPPINDESVEIETRIDQLPEDTQNLYYFRDHRSDKDLHLPLWILWLSLLIDDQL